MLNFFLLSSSPSAPSSSSRSRFVFFSFFNFFSLLCFSLDFSVASSSNSFIFFVSLLPSFRSLVYTQRAAREEMIFCVDSILFKSFREEREKGPTHTPDKRHRKREKKRERRETHSCNRKRWCLSNSSFNSSSLPSEFQRRFPLNFPEARRASRRTVSSSAGNSRVARCIFRSFSTWSIASLRNWSHLTGFSSIVRLRVSRCVYTRFYPTSTRVFLFPLLFVLLGCSCSHHQCYYYYYYYFLRLLSSSSRSSSYPLTWTPKRRCARPPVERLGQPRGGC